jgi:hypothetical protein
MPASINDKLKKYKSLFSTTLSTGIGTGTSDTITPATVTGLPTDTAITLTIDRVDASGTATPSKMERIKGVVSSGNIINYVRAVDGTTEQAHTAGAVVEMVWNADDWNNAVDHLLVEHGQDGVHSSALVTSLKAAASDINTGTEDGKIVTPKALADSDYAKTSDITVTEDSTTTLTNKTLSTGSKLDANADSNFTFNSLSRQAIINGNFDVWQRGTSIAMTAANAYAADRWYCETATAGTDKTVSREDGTGVNGSYYCARVKMVSDVDELLTFSQALESQDSIKFRGQKVTLSFYARGGAEFVADNPTLVSKIATGKGTDQKLLAFTTLADGVAQNNTLTTDWQKFTCTTTAVIAADITQIGVSFAFTHAGSGTTTNYFEVTQVQLCAGDVALPFMPKSYDEELRACQRYYQHLSSVDDIYGDFGVGYNSSTTNANIVRPFYVQMRTDPVITFSAVTDFVINHQVSLTATTGISDDRTTRDTLKLVATVASGLTAGQGCMLLANNKTTAFIGISAEL